MSYVIKNFDGNALFRLNIVHYRKPTPEGQTRPAPLSNGSKPGMSSGDVLSASSELNVFGRPRAAFIE
jgi:hypothetical protein